METHRKRLRPLYSPLLWLTAELHECLAESDQLEARIKKNLEGMAYAV